MIKPPQSRLNLSESFQQYAERLGCLCECRPGSFPSVASRHHPWDHAESCYQHNLYLAWRGYVEVIFPNRVCIGKFNLDLPDTYP